MSEALRPHNFADRHIGPDAADVAEMLRVVGRDSLDALIRDTVPAGIRSAEPLRLPAAQSEAQVEIGRAHV